MPRFFLRADQSGRRAGAFAHFHRITAAIDHPEVLEMAADEIHIIEVNIFKGCVPEGAIFKERTRHASAGYGGICKNCFSPRIIENFTFMQEIFPSDTGVADNGIEWFHGWRILSLIAPESPAPSGRIPPVKAVH